MADRMRSSSQAPIEKQRSASRHQPRGASPMPLTVGPSGAFSLAERRKPPGSTSVIPDGSRRTATGCRTARAVPLLATGRLAPYRYWLPNDSSLPALDLCRVFFEAIFSGANRIQRIAPKSFTASILERRDVLPATRTAIALARSLLARSGCGQIERTAFQRPLGCLQHHFGSCLGQKDAPMARVAGRLGRSGRGFHELRSLSGLRLLSCAVGLVPAGRQR